MRLASVCRMYVCTAWVLAVSKVKVMQRSHPVLIPQFMCSGTFSPPTSVNGRTLETQTEKKRYSNVHDLFVCSFLPAVIDPPPSVFSHTYHQDPILLDNSEDWDGSVSVL